MSRYVQDKFQFKTQSHNLEIVGTLKIESGKPNNKPFICGAFDTINFLARWLVVGFTTCDLPWIYRHLTQPTTLEYNDKVWRKAWKIVWTWGIASTESTVNPKIVTLVGNSIEVNWIWGCPVPNPQVLPEM